MDSLTMRTKIEQAKGATLIAVPTITDDLHQQTGHVVTSKKPNLCIALKRKLLSFTYDGINLIAEKVYRLWMFWVFFCRYHTDRL